MSEQTEQKIKPWQWPGEWVRDEKFWRDVGSRTASGLLVVSIGYVFAVFMGYIRNPGLWNSIGGFFSSIAVTGGFSTALISISVAVAFIVKRLTMTRAEREFKAALHEASQRTRESETK